LEGKTSLLYTAHHFFKLVLGIFRLIGQAGNRGRREKAIGP